jgi:hypothetical protein
MGLSRGLLVPDTYAGLPEERTVQQLCYEAEFRIF